MGMIDEAMKRQWTPSAQLAMESLKSAGQVAASMDKKRETKTTTPATSSGLGGLLGTGAGILSAATIPGMQGYGAAFAVGGGALGGAVEGAMTGDLGGGLTQGLMTGGTAAVMGPKLMDKGSWGELLGAKTATEQVVANADSVLGASREVANELTGEKAVWGAVKPEVARSWGF